MSKSTVQILLAGITSSLLLSKVEGFASVNPTTSTTNWPPIEATSRTRSLHSSLVDPSRKTKVDFGDDDNNINNNNGGDGRKRQHERATQIEVIKQDSHEELQSTRGANQIQLEGADNHRPAQQIQRDESGNKPHVDSSRRKPYHPFVGYLARIKETVNNPKYFAHRLDDEIKRLESRYFNLMGDDVADCRYPYDVRTSYNGPILRPPPEVYEFACRAYARAKMGDVGAQLAEDVVARYEKYARDGQTPTNKMMGSVMKAWIKAKNLKRAEHWLRKMEDKFEASGELVDVPDSVAVYTPFLRALSKKSDFHPKIAANKAVEKLNTMRRYYAMMNDPAALPTRAAFMAAMRCQEQGLQGAEALERVESLFRHLQEDFQTFVESGDIDNALDSLKPTAKTAIPIFSAASKCYGKAAATVKAANRAEDVFYEFHRLEKETGDEDYRPLSTMYDALFTMYGRMDQKNVKTFSKRVSKLLEIANENQVEIDEDAVTAALNKVMLSAEQSMPEKPMDHVLRTRSLFNIVLDTFKQFHSVGAHVRKPNISTYEIFLRACNRLPEGKTKSKLASKAFELCGQNGMVSQNVIRQVLKANPEWSCDSLGIAAKNLEHESEGLPESWSRHVPHRNEADEDLQTPNGLESSL